jgi:DNA anti-recombination protein RmuC
MDREWTDKRMDDFADRVGRFEGDVKDRFDKVDERFDRVEGRIDSLHKSIYGTTAAILAVLIAQILFG